MQPRPPHPDSLGLHLAPGRRGTCGSLPVPGAWAFTTHRPLPEQPVVREGAGRGAGNRLPPSGDARPRAGLALNPPPALPARGARWGGGGPMAPPAGPRLVRERRGGARCARSWSGPPLSGASADGEGGGRCLSARSSASASQRLSSAYRTRLLVGHPIRVLAAEPSPPRRGPGWGEFLALPIRAPGGGGGVGLVAEQGGRRCEVARAL